VLLKSIKAIKKNHMKKLIYSIKYHISKGFEHYDKTVGELVSGLMTVFSINDRSSIESGGIFVLLFFYCVQLFPDSIHPIFYNIVNALYFVILIHYGYYSIILQLNIILNCNKFIVRQNSLINYPQTIIVFILLFFLILKNFFIISIVCFVINSEVHKILYPGNKTLVAKLNGQISKKIGYPPKDWRPKDWT
jgi:hypothetical protein